MMPSRFILIVTLALTAEARAESPNPEQFLPKEIAQACPPPAKIAPYIRGCTSNFVAVEWAKSCSQALDKLSRHANSTLQKGFAAEAQKAVGSQSGNFANTSVDLALARLSLDQLITAARRFQANQKVYQSLVAYPGGEDKRVIQALGLTHVYAGFHCVKSCVDAVGAEIASTERKIGELEKGNAAAASLLSTANRRDASLSGSLTPVRKPAATGAPANAPSANKAAGRQAPGGNTITGVEKALEDKKKSQEAIR